MQIQIQPLSYYQEIAAKNRTGRVPMRLAVAIMPWRAGDIAGYAPDVARNLHAFGDAVPYFNEGQDRPAEIQTGRLPSRNPEHDDETARLNAIELSPAILAEDPLAQIAMAKRIKGVEPKAKMKVEEAVDIIKAELARREAAEEAAKVPGVNSQTARATLPQVPGA